MGLKKAIKKIIVSLTPRFIKWEIEKPFKEQLKIDQFASRSFSQEGEDLILFRIFERQKKGFYVDVGAHHPFRFSNTYKFYMRGWNGINIDPLPKTMDLFNEFRPRDVNLEIAILNDTSVSSTYYMFNEPALNTFNKLNAENIIKREGNLLKEQNIQSYKLSEILARYVQSGQHIDFLTIDVEGMDLEVIKSNNWQQFSPSYILIESLQSNLLLDLDSEISLFLKEHNYDIFAKTINTVFYKYKSSEEKEFTDNSLVTDLNKGTTNEG